LIDCSVYCVAACVITISEQQYRIHLFWRMPAI